MKKCLFAMLFLIIAGCSAKHEVKLGEGDGHTVGGGGFNEALTLLPPPGTQIFLWPVDFDRPPTSPAAFLQPSQEQWSPPFDPTPPSHTTFSVPEPAPLVLLGMGAFALLCRRYG